MLNRKSGRPPKFPEPRRPITVTLPESTLSRLAAIDADRARAIVKIADSVTTSSGNALTAELIEILPGTGIFVVGPSRSLRTISWLRLVEISPNRYLLVIPSGSSVDSLEVALLDLLEREQDEWERAVLQRLLEFIRPLRREGRISKGEVLFANTSKTTRHKRASSKIARMLVGALIPSMFCATLDLLQRVAG